MFLLQAASVTLLTNAHICFTVTYTDCCAISVGALQSQRLCRESWATVHSLPETLVTASYLRTLVCDFFSFFLCVEIFKAEKNETTVAWCRLSTIKCQHCKAEAGVMRPICHRLKWVCFFEAFSHLNVQYSFITERQKSNFFPDQGDKMLLPPQLPLTWGRAPAFCFLHFFRWKH